MTELENIVIQPLLASGILKFYARYVDDTLVLAKPSDIPLILLKLNSFDPQIQFTHEIFTNNNDVHFLDIKITPTGTAVYRKSTHTGQYVHLSSFTPWCRKIAWLRALVYRAYKICSNDELLRNELSNITKFASWNGFSKQLTNKLLKSFTPKLPNNLSNDDVVTDPPTNPPTIWIHLPFIGKRGSTLIYHCTKKSNRLLKQPAKFVTLWNTTNANAFLSTKDPTTKQHQSSVVYKFTCPGCSHSYVGKTDRCLITRLKEHSDSKDSEIFRHINSCEHFYMI